MATMEDQYNKKEDKGCLIGNWVEERALGEHTGERRYYQWEDSIGPEGPKDANQSTRWASGGAKADQNDSYRRCFVHRDNQPYDETMRAFSDATFQDPAKPRPEMQYEYRPMGSGARVTAEDQAMWKQATEEMKAEQQAAIKSMADAPRVTSTMDLQKEPPAEAYTKTLGQRVMRTRDGHPIPNDTRDLQFLIETGIRGPDCQIAKTDPGANPELNSKGDLYNDQAITFYNAAQKGPTTDKVYGRRDTEDNRVNRKFSTPIECCHQPEKV